MSASLLSAIAATAAVVVSLINVAITSRLARRQASETWVRDLLPDLAVRFSNAAFNYEREVFETDWRTLTQKEQEQLGSAAFREAMELMTKMEVFVSPKTANAAGEVLTAIEMIRGISFELVESDTFGVWETGRSGTYWAYAEKAHAFTSAVRSDMGLEPLALPPGASGHEKIRVCGQLAPGSRPSFLQSCGH